MSKRENGFKVGDRVHLTDQTVMRNLRKFAEHNAPGIDGKFSEILRYMHPELHYLTGRATGKPVKAGRVTKVQSAEDNFFEEPIVDVTFDGFNTFEGPEDLRRVTLVSRVLGLFKSKKKRDQELDKAYLNDNATTINIKSLINDDYDRPFFKLVKPKKTKSKKAKKKAKR